MSATDFHSKIATDFDNKYKTSQAFMERFLLWESILEKYIKKEDKIIDAGCGSGVLTFFLADKVSKIIGIDGSKQMIDICLKKNRELKKRVQFEQAFLPLLLNNDDFNDVDIIISSSVLEYVQELEECVIDFHNRLKINGILIVSIPNKSAIYRSFEKIVFKVFGVPSYYKYVKNIFSITDFNKWMMGLGYEYVEHNYYSNSDIISRFLKYFLSEKLTNNLFLGVYRKINETNYTKY